jgi:hypothetical protein
VGWDAQIATANRSCVKALGGTVRYTPAAGAFKDVQGIFDAQYLRVPAGQAGVQSSGPAVFLLMVDLPTDPENDEPTITVNGIAYQVTEVRKDGQGGVVLLLHKTV